MLLFFEIAFLTTVVLLVGAVGIIQRERQEHRRQIAERTTRLCSHESPRTPSTPDPPVPAVPEPVVAPLAIPTFPANPLDNPPLLHFVEDICRFCDALTRDAAFFDGERREISDHVLAKLYEAMERVPGVAVVSPLAGEPFDRVYHKTVSATIPAGATVATVQSPGILIGERVVRPALVTLE